MEVLDRFDKILNEACENDHATTADSTQCIFMCPKRQDAKVSVVIKPGNMFSCTYVHVMYMFGCKYVHVMYMFAPTHVR